MQTIHLQAPASKEPVEITITPSLGSGPPRGEARLGERVVEFSRLTRSAGQGSFVMHGRVVRYFARRHGQHLEIWVNGQTHKFEIIERVARRAGAADSRLPASNQIVSPMPGTILKLNVAAGKAFAAKEPIIIMESMKMEMTLTSSAPGRVKQIHCTVGQLVEQGALLATLELDEAAP